MLDYQYYSRLTSILQMFTVEGQTFMKQDYITDQIQVMKDIPSHDFQQCHLYWNDIPSSASSNNVIKGLPLWSLGTLSLLYTR